jgi:hypothetical protein
MTTEHTSYRHNLPREQKLKLLKLASLRHAARTGELWQGENPKRMELSGPNGGPINVNVTKITSRVIDSDYTDITDVVVQQQAEEPEQKTTKSTTVKVRTSVV